MYSRLRQILNLLFGSTCIGLAAQHFKCNSIYLTKLDLHKMFHPSFTNITMSINKTLTLYENYVCLQFDIKARRVNLQVKVNNSKLSPRCFSP